MLLEIVKVVMFKTQKKARCLAQKKGQRFSQPFIYYLLSELLGFSYTETAVYIISNQSNIVLSHF